MPSNISAVPVAVAEPDQPLADDVEQLGDVLQRLGLEPVHQELLPLEAHLQAEPAQLLVPLRDRLHAANNSLYGPEKRFLPK